MIVDSSKCIGCGSCAADCVFGSIKIENGKAKLEGRCILCGHCVAICKEDAVAIEEYDASEIEHISGDLCSIDISNLLHVIKLRRSIRRFTEQSVEQPKLENIVQAGRYTATGSNRQSCKFVVVRDKLKELKETVWNGIDEILKKPDSVDESTLKLIHHLDNMRLKNIDFLFRNAPVVIYVASESTVDAALAAQNMELAAVTQGLGVMYNGFLVGITNKIMAASAMLDLEEKPVVMCMLVGYPMVKYQRSAPRRKADVVWK